VNMRSDSHKSKKQGPQSGGQDDSGPPKDVQDTALSYIKKLRESDPIRYERPKVTVIDKRG
jgi:hypothetical protein